MAEQSALTGTLIKRRDFEQEARPPLASPDIEHESITQAAPLEEHYAGVIGAFKDDPMLDAMMANIRERRRAMDADDTIE
jgi:hypothetical protein